MQIKINLTWEQIMGADNPLIGSAVSPSPAVAGNVCSVCPLSECCEFSEPPEYCTLPHTYPDWAQ